MKLSSAQLHVLRLARKEADGSGWTKVSRIVWPLVSALPADLVEKRPAEDGGGHIRLTDRGDAVVFYS